MWSYVVTVVGLPFAIAVFVWEQRKERAAEDEEVYQRLSDEYAEFLKLVLSKQGQEVVVKDGYIPLPKKVVDKTMQDLGL